MWIGLATQQAKTEAEHFSNEQNIRRNAESIGNRIIQQAAKRAKQAAKDEALWKQMKREFPQC